MAFPIMMLHTGYQFVFVAVTVLHPVQQSGFYCSQTTALPLVEIKPTEVTACDKMPNLLTRRPMRIGLNIGQ